MAAHVYHWKHGWIPLDHVALKAGGHPSQATGPIKGASKVEHSAHHPHPATGIRTKRQLAHAASTVHNVPAANRGAAAAEVRAASVRLGGSAHVSTTSGRLVNTGIPATAGDQVLSAAGQRQAVAAATSELHRKASAAEPALTRSMQQLANDHGGQLQALEHRLKTPDSLSRKIATDVRDKGIPPHEVAASLYDVNRYTIALSHTDYAASSQAALNDLVRAGHQVKVKNYWNVADNPYQGINVQVTAPDGHRYEVQFHTGDSLKVKNGELHALYERIRVSKSDEEIGRLTEQSFKVSRTIPVPPGVAGVHQPTSPSAQSASSMTPAQRIDAAAQMFGTGSRQHRAAQAKFSAPAAKKAAPSSGSGPSVVGSRLTKATDAQLQAILASPTIDDQSKAIVRAELRRRKR